MGTECIRILLVDDHTLLRETMRDVLVAEDGFQVVGEAADGDQAVVAATQVQPDVVLLDVEMPRNRPAETVENILGASPASKVIILSMHDAPHVVRDMVKSGVSGYLHKSVSRHGLAAAIRNAYRDTSAERRVVVSVSHEVLTHAAAAPQSVLSPREREVLALVGAALSNRQIAARLSITEATVKRHLRNTFEKLGAVSRIDAVNKATALLRGADYPR